MGMLKKVGSDNSQVSSLFKIDSGGVPFKGIGVHFYGTSNNGTVALASDFGRLKYRIRGKSIIDMEIQGLMAYWKNHGGFCAQNSTSNAQLDFWVYIPRWYGSSRHPNNVEVTTKEDMAELELVFAFAAAPVLFNTAIYLDLHQGISAYNLTAHQINEPQMAASSVINKTYYEENLLEVELADMNAALQFSQVFTAAKFFSTTVANQGSYDITVGTLQGGATAWASRAWADGLRNGDSVQIVPSAAVLYDANGDQINNKLVDQIQLNLNNGAGGTMDPRILLFGAKLNPYALASTTAQQQALFQQNLAREAQAGHTQAVSILSKLGS